MSQTYEEAARTWALERPGVEHQPTHEYSYRPDYAVSHVASRLWWAVPCPLKTCRAAVDQWCSNGGTHERRKLAYRARFGYGPPDAEKPPWWHALMRRREQRRALVALEQVTFNSSLSNRSLLDARARVAELGVESELAREAERHGRVRARVHLGRERRRRQGRR